MDTHGGNPYKSLELKQVSIVQINVDSTREWFLVHIFLYLIMFLLHLCPGLHAITNFTILCRFATKNRGRNDFSHFTIFRYFFVYPTYQRALPNSTNSAKLQKLGPKRLFLLYYFLLLFGLSHLPEGASEVLAARKKNLTTNRARKNKHTARKYSQRPFDTPNAMHTCVGRGEGNAWRNPKDDCVGG